MPPRALLHTLLALLLLAASPRPAAEAAETIAINLTVPTIRVISVDTASLAFPPISSLDFSRGYVEIADAITITISSNAPWQLSVKTAAANLGVVNGYAKPLDDLLWRKPGGTVTSITMTEALVASSDAHIRDQTITLDVRMLLSWTRDLPGNYGTYLTLTLAEPAP